MQSLRSIALGRSLGSLLLTGGFAVALCSACGVPGSGAVCASDADCASGEHCVVAGGLSTCLRHVRSLPPLEVYPPAQNNQGWVPEEFPVPQAGSDGRVALRLSPSVSVEGRVYDSMSRNKLIPAQIIAWRDSLVEGRPRVQLQTSTPAGNGDDQRDTFVLWLNSGFSYTFVVVPKAPYDAEYPPRVESGLRVDNHLKKDFPLDGVDRAVQVQGRILDAAQTPLGVPVRVRARAADGLHRSTMAESDAATGAFSIRVPAGVRTYTLRVESAPGATPIPAVECTGLVLGIFTSIAGQNPVQSLGDLRLPAFLHPKPFSVSVRGKDGSPAAWSTVTFTSAPLAVPTFTGANACTAVYEQSAITDAAGKATLLLLPGSAKENQEYAVTVVTPAGSLLANVFLPACEVGPSVSPGALPEITLPLRARLRGKVVLPDNRPLPAAVIEAQGIATSSDKSPAGASSAPVANTLATAGDDGAFELYLEPGVYNFDIRPSLDSVAPSFGMRNVKITGEMNGLVLRVPQAEVLGGRLLDPSGRELPGAKVQVFELVNASETTYRSTVRSTSITGPEGGFTLLLPASER